MVLPLSSNSARFKSNWSWGTEPNCGKSPPPKGSLMTGWCLSVARSSVTSSTLWKGWSSAYMRASQNPSEVSQGLKMGYWVFCVKQHCAVWVVLFHQVFVKSPLEEQNVHCVHLSLPSLFEEGQGERDLYSDERFGGEMLSLL